MKLERIQKAQSICKKILGEYIISHMQDLSVEHGLVTITQVKLSPDLSYLDVYVSCLRSPEALCKNLAPEAENMQRILAKNIAFLKIPRLRFRYDESGENAFHITQTLHKVQQHEK